MKPKEALDWCEQFTDNLIMVDCDRKKRTLGLQAMRTCKSALKKQIPKKPRKEIWVDDEKRKSDVRLATKDDVLTKDNHGTITHCPNCDEWVTVQKYLSPPKYDLFCKHCGQALDWSDTE